MKKAVIINAASKYLNIILNLLVSAVLARLIEPSDYGIMAVITVFTTFFSTLSDMGLGTAIIQNKSLSEEDVGSIFSLSVYISGFLAMAFWLFSYAIAAFYSDAIYVKIGHWLSVPLVFNSINMVPNGLLNREKRFLDMAVRNVVVYLLSAVVAIIAALNGAGIFALILQSILSSLLIFVWSELLTRHRFSLRFRMESIRKVANYSGYQYAFSILNYFSRNLDNLLVGKFIGPTELGYYNRAYSLMLYPINNITGVITPVLHPILSDYQNDKDFIYRQYMKLIKLIATISVFVEVCCIFLASDLIQFVYGDKWIGSIQCFRILSVAIATQMITGTTGSIFQSLGQTRLLFITGCINVTITILGTIIGIFCGNTIEFLAVCVAASYLLHFIVAFYIMMRFGFRRAYFKFLLELTSVIGTLLVLILAGVVCPFAFESHLRNLIAKGAYFFAIYVLCLFITGDYKVLKFLWKGRQKYD